MNEKMWRETFGCDSLKVAGSKEFNLIVES
jgi:hypothetical protein